jgi:hypothetical protein
MRQSVWTGEYARKVGLWWARAAAAFAIGCLLVLSSPVVGSSAEASAAVLAPVATVATVAPVQQPTGDAPPAAPPGSNSPAPQWGQHTAVGVVGIVLILLVLLTRKLRKKPVFGTWRLKK